MPTLDPAIVFAGYVALSHFALALVARGWRVRLVLCEVFDETEGSLRERCRTNPLLISLLDACEVSLPRTDDRGLTVSPGDAFVAYSWATAQLAASATRGRPFLYFIQEYEPAFSGNDSLRVLAEASYELDHIAVFNTDLLRDYFRNERIGVFRRTESEGLRRSRCFAPALTPVAVPTTAELSSRGRRRLLFYARPEEHAGRNLFEVGVLALEKAIAAGVFDGTWEFVGLGAQATVAPLRLASGRTLELLRRVSLEEYARMLPMFDVGLSLMFAPHPSLPPLEMAAAGLVTVTTSCGSRDAARMRAISANLIAVEPRIDAIGDGLARAVARSADFDGRIAASTFAWPRHWDEAFDEGFMGDVEDLLIPDRRRRPSLDAPKR